MADLTFTPIAAAAFDGAIVLTDRTDKRLILDMPNAASATFCAAALDNELKRARRPGE